jgi:hypothetical protein
MLAIAQYTQYSAAETQMVLQQHNTNTMQSRSTDRFDDKFKQGQSSIATSNYCTLTRMPGERQLFITAVVAMPTMTTSQSR